MKKLQLQIPIPCHEDWDKMTPVEKGRYCGSCQKQVVDFSNMDDREIAMFFKKPSTGSVCGRFMQDQLDRDIEIPRKRIPWVKYFFQFLLPGFLISCRMQAQGKVKVIEKNSIVNTSCQNVTVGQLMIESPIRKISGIKPKKERKKMTLLPVTQFPKPVERTSMDIEQNPGLHASMKLQQSLPGYAGAVTIISGEILTTRCYVRKVSKPMRLFQRIFKDTAFSKFKVYPNPVKSNSILNIEWKQTEEGYYILQLFNQSGQAVFVKEIFVDKEAKLLSVDLPSIPAGSYFLRMTHKVSNKSYTEKIIVQ